MLHITPKHQYAVDVEADCLLTTVAVDTHTNLPCTFSQFLKNTTRPSLSLNPDAPRRGKNIPASSIQTCRSFALTTFACHMITCQFIKFPKYFQRRQATETSFYHRSPEPNPWHVKANHFTLFFFQFQLVYLNYSAMPEAVYNIKQKYIYPFK